MVDVALITSAGPVVTAAVDLIAAVALGPQQAAIANVTRTTLTTTARPEPDTQPVCTPTFARDDERSNWIVVARPCGSECLLASQPDKSAAVRVVSGIAS